MEQRNMLMAFVLSMLVLVGWQMLFPPPPSNPPAAEADVKASSPETQSVDRQAGVVSQDAVAGDGAPVERAEERGAPDEQSSSRDAAVVARLHNRVLEVAVNGRGTLIGATLRTYRESIEEGAPPVRVLHLSDKQAQYVSSGVMEHRAPVQFKLVESGPNRVVLQAPLGAGKLWRRELRLKKDSYALEIDDRIIGGAGDRLYLQAVERYPDKKLNTFYEHAGPIGLLNGKLQEPDYDDLDEQGPVRQAGIGGWCGIMSRYFLTAIYGDQKGDYRYFYKGNGRAYQAGIIMDGKVDGKDALFHANVFIGPKSIDLLESFGVGLERSVDYGWFAFIAKPMHQFMLWLYSFVHNFGVCIILLVILIKLVFFLPSQKSYTSMAAMRKIQPEMKRLQERYADDRQKLGEEMMKLYKKHKVNPLSGCLPILIQIPVFFALYKVLLMSIEMRQAPFFGWIQDLSVHDPWFILPVLMGASMFVQMKLNPQPPDPMQAKVMQFLPVVFTVMFLFFPAGLVLYWLVNNVLSIVQQRLVMRKLGV